MKKYLIIVMIAIMTLAIAGCSDDEPAEGEMSVMLSIDFPDESSYEDIEDAYVFIHQGATVFEVLEAYCLAEGISVTVEEGSSPFVTAIGDVSTGATTGWIYEMNGEQVMESPFDLVVTEEGTSCEWEFIDFSDMDDEDTLDDDDTNTDPAG